jgi:hypothetical protein
VVSSIFERLGKNQPINNPKKERLEPKLNIEKFWIDKATERLRDWLVNRWTKPTISVREICIFGPHPLRNAKIARSLTEILAEQGWLIPLKGRRLEIREWQIVPKTSKALFLSLTRQQQLEQS